MDGKFKQARDTLFAYTSPTSIWKQVLAVSTTVFLFSMEVMRSSFYPSTLHLSLGKLKGDGVKGVGGKDEMGQ